MILQALVAYYEALAARGEISRPGWSSVKVSYALEIDENGRLIDVLPTKVQTADGKRSEGRPMAVPERVKRSSGIVANFLCDNALYLLGIGDADKPDRAAQCFLAAKALHLSLLEKAETPAAKAICAFFERWDPAQAREHPLLAPLLDELTGGANLVFYCGGYAHEETELARAWQDDYDGEAEGEPMRCLVTGNLAVPAAVHPAIKGVKDAQSSGAALVSFNAPAYCSFEREQNYNAPVSKYAAFAYTTALNHLLADKKHTLRIGDATVVYWAEHAQPVYQDMFSYFMGEGSEMRDEDLEAYMRAIASGGTADWDGIPVKPDNRFYVLALAPNAARLSVRFFLRDSFGHMVRNLRAHYDRLAIVGDGRGKSKDIPMWALLRETVNEKSRDKAPSPQMAGDTLRAVLTDTRYPATLYQQTQLRIRAERTVTHGRAAIIKAYLMKNTDDEYRKEALEMQLNEATTYQPYVLGRLFAILEEVQNRASGVTTIKDKYFSSACATPAVVFPLIMNLSDKHLRKHEGGMKVYYAKQIGALTAMLTESYPAHHSLYDQGVFQLGYYHQTQKRYEKKNTTATIEEEN